MSNKITFALVAALLTITSCTIEKRLYNKGFHVEWNKRLQSNSTDSEPIQTNSFKAGELLIDNESVTVSPTELDEALPTTKNVESSTAPVKTVEQVIQTPQEQVQNSKSELAEKQSSRYTVKHESKKIQNASASNGGKLQIVALILCILLGLIGIHRFYLGYTGLGVLYLFTLGLFGIGWIIDIILLIIPNGLTPKGKDNYKG